MSDTSDILDTRHTRRSNTGTEVKANQDLVAIGLSNAVGSFFNAYPVAGSFGRTAVSSRSGARSTLSGAITACFIFFVLLVMMPVFEFLPYVSFFFLNILSPFLFTLSISSHKEQHSMTTTVRSRMYY